MQETTADEGSFRALVVDDEASFGRALARKLRRQGMETDTAVTGAQGMDLAERTTYDLILLDQRLPDTDGVDLLPRLLRLQPGTCVVLMTAYEAIASAVEAMRRGAEDYLVKSTSLDPLVDKALEVRSRCELGVLRTALQSFGHRLTGESPAILRALEQLREVSQAPGTTVLLLGESGVGKEVAARFLHSQSGRPESSFVPVDCVALPAALAESHLFGHEKGAFTGASTQHRGYFETAGDGTVFLDEIGDMDLSLQGKLLRVLENRTFRRVGATQELDVEARLVASTNRDLGQLVEAGQFRHDLYHRLSVFPVYLPPLRERGDDIVLLANEFIALFNERLDKHVRPLGAEIIELLRSYDFPGNVRELKNLIERAMVHTRTAELTRDEFPDRLGRGLADGEPGLERLELVPGVDTLEQVERKMVLDALERAGGNRTRAAELLGITRYALLRRLQKFGLA